ncbi:TonB-dependent receptor plug domain-containing protein [Termitidicoccus mucosus]|uniref:TonB-dependent receptor plug domain-containing protein n=1 Tax=Termitidicoccus mucosus TaxID=1184151 RepID=A0A178ICH6_9BACT|nr:hypothetical protein AW736_23000 [Opitutaceae bacterium TSB47]
MKPTLYKYILSLTAIVALLASAAPARAQATRNNDDITPPPPTSAVPVVTASEASSDEVVHLTPYEVTAASDTGYYATQTLASSRINTKIEDVGSALSIITSDFFKDTGVTDNKTLLTYTPNTEVGGLQGNYRGSSGGGVEDETGRFTSPSTNTRVRGLAAADNTRNYFISEIPWDGYNVSRVEIQRGPNSILFGLGSPAGIINTTTKMAEHKKSFGSLELRVGSYGANRAVLDWNQNLLKDELSVRFTLLHNEEKYRQDPAYSRDQRFFGTLRYDPKFLSRNGHKTTLKLNFESGDVKSNNPRTITPRDQVTKWWDALNKQGYDPRYVQNSGWFYDENGVPYRRPNTGQFNRNYNDNIPFNPATPNPAYPGDGNPNPNNIDKYLRWTVADAGHPLPNAGAANPDFSPWLGESPIYGGIWLQTNAGQTFPYRATMPEYKNIRGIGSNGDIDGTLGLPYSRRVTVANTNAWAARANVDEGAKYQSFGVWKASTLTDASIFDFYNNLLDGDNKEEWQDFKNFSASLSQSFFRDKMGFDLAYDHSNYKNGQYSFDGAGVLYVDVNTHNIDGTENPHFGQPYIESNLTYGNNAYESTRNAGRLSAFLKHDFNESGRGGWLRKLLGSHTLTGLLSTERWRSDSRTFSRYAAEPDFAQLVANPTTGAWFVGDSNRSVNSTIYLGDSLKNAATYQGAGISRATGKLQIPNTMPFQWFDSTWNAGPGVDPAAEWINPYNGATSTQSENPANYVGWTTTNVGILSAENGDQDLLTRAATRSKRVVTSMAVAWQAWLWDGALVGLYGLRQDRVKSWALAGERDSVYGNVLFDRYDLSYVDPALYPQVYTGNTKSWSVVAKLNSFLRGRLPVNVSLFYNESDNFQVAGSRNDLYGNPLPPPTGDTKDYGIMLSTKNQRYVLKINKYESHNKNAGNSVINNNTWYLMDGASDNNFISRAENRIDQFQYHGTTRGTGGTIVYLDADQPSGTPPWSFGQKTGESLEHSNLTRMAVVAAWRAFTAEAPVRRVLDAWGFDDLDGLYGSIPKTPLADFRATEDQLSKGWEIEFTANPTKNWRVTVNASQTKASRTNVGGSALTEFVTYANQYFNKRLVPVAGPGEGVITVNDGLYRDGSPGQAYHFRWATATEVEADRGNIAPGNHGNDANNTTFAGIGGYNMWTYTSDRDGGLISWNSNFYRHYSLLKLQEGTYSTELRRWRVNLVTNYDFRSGPLKGFNIGLGYRWQDKVVIGYPVIEKPATVGESSIDEITFDLDHPYYGPKLDAVDLWVGYERNLSRKLKWRIQLNIRNLGDGKKLIPLSAQWDGTVAAWGIAPSQTWTVTNTFSF